MKDIDQENLDTAIVVGNSICKDLDMCCEKRARVIHQIYKKLEELKPVKDSTVSQQSDEVQTE